MGLGVEGRNGVIDPERNGIGLRYFFHLLTRINNLQRIAANYYELLFTKRCVDTVKPMMIWGM